jgi:hypothetical protein
MINEAAEALMNDETTSLGKYTFEPIASGLGGTRVNIYVEPGMEDSVGYFMLDPGEYREPSDMLDAFYDKISEFLENNPDSEEGTGGTGPGAKFMPAGNPALFGKKPFFIGVASLLDGKIEETHTYEEGEAADWHHTFMISKPIKEKMESGENVLFWVDPDGKINLDSGQWWNEPVDPEDWKRILPEIQKQIRPNPAVKFMPAGPLSSSQVDQSLAGVTGPDADQGPLSGARFMPGYNPRYTDDDGNFDYGLYSEDRRKTIAYLRDRMGITRKDFPNEEEWKRTIRETMRDVIRGG